MSAPSPPPQVDANTVPFRRFRDQFRDYTPWWLLDRVRDGLVVGYCVLWAMIAQLDVYVEILLQGMAAAFPGLGTPTALPLIGRARTILRGQSDTDDEYAARLVRWLDYVPDMGSMRGLAVQLHEWLGNRPRVRIFNRAGVVVTVDAAGAITTASCAWDWDSVSNPERAGYWSELWIVIYASQWANRGHYAAGSKWGVGGKGLGHLVSRSEYDIVRALIGQWKMCGARVRAVIWTSNATLFDPATPASLPDGTWGQWSKTVAGSCTPSSRVRSDCRYWEPQEV